MSIDQCLKVDQKVCWKPSAIEQFSNIISICRLSGNYEFIGVAYVGKYKNEGRQEVDNNTFIIYNNSVL